MNAAQLSAQIAEQDALIEYYKTRNLQLRLAVQELSQEVASLKSAPQIDDAEIVSETAAQDG